MTSIKRKEVILDDLVSILSQVTKLKKSDINIYDHLIELGVDSIIFTQVKSLINSKYNIEIPITMFLDTLNNLNAISEYINVNTPEEIPVEAIKDTEFVEILKATEDRNDEKIDNLNENLLDKHKSLDDIIEEEDYGEFSMKEVAASIEQKQHLPIEENQQNWSWLENIFSKQINLLSKQVETINNLNIKPLAEDATVPTDNVIAFNRDKDIKVGKNKQMASRKSQVKQDVFLPYTPLQIVENPNADRQKQEYLQKLIHSYTTRTGKSKKTTQFYRSVYASNRNVAGFRPSLKELVYQIIAEEGNGSKMIDVDGNQYIDLTMGFGVNLFGHNPSFVEAALLDEINHGMPLGPMGRLAGDVAKSIHEMTGVERVAYYNTGTEANMVALRIARAATGKKKIVLFAGSYHGTFDGVLGAQAYDSKDYGARPLAPGILPNMVEDLMILNYNDSESFEIIRKYSNEIAGVLVEPIQSRRPDIQPKAFLTELRKLTEELSIALIFDEIITGFRIEAGGIQKHYNIQADIVTYGKVIGGGLPIGIVAGKRKFLDCIDGGLWSFGDDSIPPHDDKRTFVAGTFCHHPLAMAAAKATLNQIKETGESLYQDLNNKTKYLVDKLNNYFDEGQIPINVIYFGSLFRFVLKGDFEIFYYGLLDKGIYIWEGRNCFLSTAHTDEDIENIIKAVYKTIEEMKAAGFFPNHPPSSPIKKEEERKEIPLTNEQKNILLQCGARCNSSAFNEAIIFEINGSLNVEALQKAVTVIVNRYEILRSVINQEKGVQEISNESEVKINRLDFKEFSVEDTSMTELLEKECTKDFDLRSGPPINISLICVKDRYILIISMHHIIGDGWSLALFCKELQEIYEGEVLNKAVDLKEPVQFREYLQWRDELLNSNVAKEAKLFWKNKLENVSKFVNLPQEKFETRDMKNEGDRYNWTIDGDLLKGLRKLSASYKNSLLTTMLTAFKILLNKLTGQSELTIGLPIAGQNIMNAENLMGNCVSIAPLNTIINDECSFGEMLNNIKAELLKFEEIKYITPDMIEDFADEISSINLNVVFNMDRTIFDYDFYGTTTEMILPTINQVKYDLMLNVIDVTNQLKLHFDYNSNIISKETIERWAGYYLNILKKLIENSNRAVVEIEMITNLERQEIYNKYSNISTDTLKKKLDVDLGLFDLEDVREGKCYVLDDNMKLQPLGIEGNLHIGRSDVEFYFTGERAKFDGQGELIVLGPHHKQVFIDERKVNLNVVENTLKLMDGIVDVYCTLDENTGKMKAYIIAIETLARVNELVDFLRGYLPEYMIPKEFIQIREFSSDGMDLNSIDNVAELDGEILFYKEEKYDGVENQLIRLWKDILTVDFIGVNDDFFLLGGNSLKATRLLAKVQLDFNVKLPLNVIFKEPTIKYMANVIRSNSKIEVPVKLEVVEASDYYEVSSAQKRMYALHKLGNNSLNYNVPIGMIVEGNFEKAKLQSTINQLIKRHEILRTSFEEIDGEVHQRVVEHLDLQIEYIEKDSRDEKTFIDDVISSFVRPFDLNKLPLLRVGLIKLQEEKHLLLIDLHHSIFDGASGHIFGTEFVSLYSGKKLEKPAIQYKDFAVWQNKLKKTDYMRQQKHFWINRISKEVPTLNIHTDYKRPIRQSHKGRIINMLLSDDLSAEINRLVQETQTTPYMVFLAALNLLLAKYSMEEDIIIGTPVEGRNHPMLQEVMGMFVNTLAMRNYPEQDKKFYDFLQELKENTLSAFDHSDYQLEDLIEALKIKKELGRNPLFDVIFVYQNNDQFQFSIDGLNFKEFEISVNSSKVDLTFEIREVNNQFLVNIEYNTEIFKERTIEILGEHFLNILNSITSNSDVLIKDIDILSEKEKQQLLVDFNNTKTEYPKEKTINQLFEEQVEKTPNDIAVEYNDQSLTYKELNEKSNQLAQFLRKKGVRPDNIVGLMVEPSLEMMVGILGILKSGAAYLPINLEYPSDRISYMLTDCQVEILLIQENLNVEIDFKGEVVNLKDTKLVEEETSNLETINKPDNLAYVIYTSGSTGKPKGNLTMHFNVVRLLKNSNYIEVTSDDVLLQLSSYAFDGSVFDIYAALTNGAKLILINKETAVEVNKLAKVIKDKNVTVFFITTALFNVLVDLELSCLQGVRKVLFGGERVSVQHVKKALEYVGKDKLVHVYGPTESTVYATYYNINGIEESAITIPIGKPLSNTELYVLDGNNKLQPLGVAGELCISGDGLARGYLNNPQLTEEKFVDNPFVEGEKMYKTGDVVRWLPDGNIEFLDRLDHQVKIRGFRIELGEIENQLLSHESINEAVVVAREKEEGGKYLCGYFVAMDETLSIQALRKFLAKELPEYMIPSYLIPMDKFPLNQNGKIDKKALPLPDGNILTGLEYEEARNKIEEVIVETWKEVLGVSRVSINDNFFTLGGDSIKAIQVSARLKGHNLELETKHLLLNPSIKELSQHVKTALRRIDQSPVIGKVELTPIQKWFFDSNFSDEHHWNLSMMLYRKDNFDEGLVREVFNKIGEHHDLLRAVYYKGAEEVVQEIRDCGVETFELMIYDFTEENQYEERIKEEVEKIQSTIDLVNGPIVKLGLFRTLEGDHLLIAVHHLVIDGVSWRILLEDFKTGYSQLLEGNSISLPDKTDSFKAWSKELRKYVNDETLLKELNYWQEIEDTSISPLPKDHVAISNRVKDGENQSIILNPNDTEKLLKYVNKSYNTEINDILLATLGLSFKEWTGENKILISLEGHGREEINQIDVSRTIGWFTSVYPVILDVTQSDNLSFIIRNTKETLRRVPQKGIGYGILKHLTSKINGNIGLKKKPEVCFNYLGQFDREVNTDIFQFSSIEVEGSIAADLERNYRIEIDGMITNGELRLNFNYNKQEYETETIIALMEKFSKNLLLILEHCLEKEGTELTPYDTTAKHLDINEFDQAMEVLELAGFTKGEVKDIYPLSPMQEGMLFHAIVGESTETYFEQADISIEGKMDEGLFEKAFNALIEKYDVLRTVFVYDKVKQPLQAVLEDRKVKVSFVDLTDLGQEEKVNFIGEYKREDKKRGFDLAKDKLLRMSIIKTEINQYQLIWSFHHIILDGWCLGIIIKDLLENYRILRENKPLMIVKGMPYSNFIQWLQNQNRQEGIDYWKKYLKGYEEQIEIPYKNKENKSLSGYQHKEMEFTLDKELTSRLTSLAQEMGLTVNTLFQTAWGILLQKYNNTKDVVFGAIVSGRPSEINGIENMVGLFINTIPVRMNFPENINLTEIVEQVQTSAVQSSKYDYLSLAEIQAETELKRDLINHVIAFENYPLDKEIGRVTTKEGEEFVIKKAKIEEQGNYDFNIIVLPEAELTVVLSYNSLVYDEAQLEKIEGHLKKILRYFLEAPSTKLSEIDILTDKEKEEILYQFNNTKADYPEGKTINELFEEVVEKNPGHVAVVYEDRKLTYRELNEKANQLARLLRKEGVELNSIVGIMAERSLEMIIGKLAVLKAGGVYLPIDSEYPQKRIEYMMEDSGLEVLLTQSHLMEGIGYRGKTIALDDPQIYQGSGNNLETINKANDLAYIIYTSGSTGNPKGVMVEHAGVANLTTLWKQQFLITEEDRILQFASSSFDASVWDIFMTLLLGAQLYLIPSDVIKDSSRFEEYLIKNKITTATLPPTYLSSLIPENLTSLKRVISAGSALNKEIMDQWRRDMVIINAYGPTEGTICSTMIFGDEIGNRSTVPIGKPLPNIKAYIVSADEKLQPVGVAGELWISGVGLARGYLNKQELTAEKFGNNPYVSNERVYRTGDLAKWLPDGNIEFLGRIDHQVKIRGYRIEIGEVENCLLGYEGIKEVVVIARENQDKSKYLCGFIIATNKIDIVELRKYLLEQLPEFMIPAHFIQMEQFPLTSNGKIDLKSLPEVGGMQLSSGEFEEPRNEKERVLMEVWKEILGIEGFGINDNFFTLGGDSIKAIQVSARLQRYKLKLETKHLLLNPVIKEVSKFIVEGYKEVNQGPVVGEVKLTPIQKWYFDRNFTEGHHWNLSMLLRGKTVFSEEGIVKVFKKLMQHHDLLRTVYELNGDEVVQKIQSIESDVSLKVYDFINEVNYGTKLKEKANEIQSSIDLRNGPLLKLALFKTQDADYLLIAIHHLVVDVVSWRILLEDFNAAYSQFVKNEEVKLPPKTNSFMQWASEINAYANSKVFLEEVDYWKAIERNEIIEIPKDYQIEANLVKDEKMLTTSLNREETEKLLRKVNQTYNTEISDILLTSLGLAMRKWIGGNKILINLEGHGRESINEMDVSRTVGWYTSMYPVIFDFSDEGDLVYQIKTVKETLRKIPHKGIGYGLLKYLTSPENKKELVFNLMPEVSFNYLGQLDNELNTDVFELSDLSKGDEFSPNGERTHSIEINGLIINGEFVINLSFNKHQYNEATINNLLSDFKGYLEEIIQHCLDKKDIELTPSDITAKKLNIKDLDHVVRELEGIGYKKNNIKDIYPLAPMQEGMLYHSIMNDSNGSYFEQASFTVDGELDILLFGEAFNGLVKKYDVLRSLFLYKAVKEPLQVVLKDREIKIHYEDISGFEENKKSEYVDGFKQLDKLKAFDLTGEPLMRISIIKTDHKLFEVIWSFHHIIMDGWCLGIIAEDLFGNYRTLADGKALIIEKETPYSNFIKWIESQKKQEGLNYWKNYLEGYDEKVVLPYCKNNKLENEYTLNETVISLSEEATDKVTLLAKSYGVTINTIFQAVWGILLQKYCYTDDVVFGTTVSGRPSEIDGIENMVGLFINTIPVRMNFNSDSKFEEIIKDIQNRAFVSSKYDYLPLAEIQAQSELKRDLIDHIIVFENYPIDKEIDNIGKELGLGFDIKDARINEQVNYDFSITVVPDKELTIIMSYNDSVYDPADIQLIEGHIKTVINQIIEKPDVKLAEIKIISEEEEGLILHRFNKEMGYHNNKTIHQYFEEQAEKTPYHIALVLEKDQLTYDELNKKSNQLARVLLNKGIKTDSIVGVMTHPSLEMIVGIMAVLKAGGAYLPIDPQYPQDRINHMIEDSGTHLLLTTKDISKDLKLFRGEVLLLDEEGLYSGEDHNLGVITNSSSLAYVMYTSGSTGKSKGVMVEHRNVVSYTGAFIEEFGLTENDAVLQQASFSFDTFTEEVYPILFKGGKLVITNKNNLLDMDKLREIVLINSVSVISCSPLLLNEFNKYKLLEGIRLYISGGDVLKKEYMTNIISDKRKVYNSYGPTETTVCATYYQCSGLEKDSIPIGKPIHSSNVLILDRDGNLLPVGAIGEIYISGMGVTRGYLNRPELTEEKFLDNPYIEGKMYRSGDLGRWLPEGNIEFLGRVDHQVKLRGYRIELGEIENVLLNHSDIKGAVVIARDNERGEKYLSAYVVGTEDLKVQDLKGYLSKELPNYMIPSYYVNMEAIPITVNGKVNKKALPSPVEEEVFYEEQLYTAPRDKIEEEIASIWAEILYLDKVGIEDNFFDIGGDSLKLIRIMSAMTSRGFEVTLNDILYHQNIRALRDNCITKGRDDKNLSSKEVIEDLLKSHFNFAMQYLTIKINKTSRDLLLIDDLYYDHREDVLNCFKKNNLNHLLPHYVLRMTDGMSLKKDMLTETEFTNLLKNYRQESSIDKVAELVKGATKSLEESVISGKIIRNYNLAAVQEITKAINMTLSGTVINFDAGIDLEVFNKSILNIVKEEGLLRSILIEKGQSLEIQELEAPESVNVPFLDLTYLEPEFVNRVLNQVVRELFTNNYKNKSNITNKLLYTILLVKFNEKEFKAYLPFNHIVFDGMSSEYIKNIIVKTYENNGIKNSYEKTLDYHSYIEQITKGPEGISEEEIIALYELEKFGDSANEFQAQLKKEKSKLRSTIITIELNEEEGNLISSKGWEVAFSLFLEVVRFNFKVKEAPIAILHTGRRYQDKNYYNTVGEFLDIIPYTVNLEAGETVGFKKIKTLMEIAYDKNINFTTLAIDKALEANFSNIRKLINKLDILKLALPVFNYVGLFEEESDLKGIELDGINQGAEVEGLITDIALNNNKITVNTYCKADEESKLEDYLKSVVENLN
ncbi:non-ribosomal peptide synthetase [Alkaliphilus transvaalensis]|uniref:non-ribosomal peptide synthetase n=1 Tax=Alkaliphilus transvaalensis TaxID=114628 RepID=UPI00047C7480|nr:non-ribosomal peptide synthetase [Alkaliphilus transvaalensis]